ncbi:MAG: UDP-N-acetylglucosamine 1-carboxyvinyltransferase [Firmicutes bacterium]|nr:UDP-N-acetylglucosamine 1-carboxyvinyltransferase [Bacillota bacterium]
MDKIVVRGGSQLRGQVAISGSKNAALAILPAVLLASRKVSLSNVPDITDVRTMLCILENLGLTIRRRGRNAIDFYPSRLRGTDPPFNLVQKLRASSYLMGSLLTRFGSATVPVPGGCDLGPRPIDQHLKGFTALGAGCEIEHGLIKLRAEKLTGARVYLDVVSVGATVNLMLAAAGAEGRTVLENAAKEPEIVDLANFLNALGAIIKGAGTDVIKIDGVKKFGGAEHMVIPDRIEAGTFMFAVAATGGDLVVGEVIPKHLEAVTAKLREIGAVVEVESEQIRVCRNGPLNHSDLKTFPYPGFPTDLQPLGMVLLTAAKGTSIITENVFDGRFRQIDELKKMGAQIKLEGRSAVINGGGTLSGAPVTATDLRAGAALIVAGLIAKGDTILSEAEHVYRGYEKIEEKLTSLGAQLKPLQERGFCRMVGDPD